MTVDFPLALFTQSAFAEPPKTRPVPMYPVVLNLMTQGCTGLHHFSCACQMATHPRDLTPVERISCKLLKLGGREQLYGSDTGIRTRILALRGPRPNP